jgi:hypothetical protein
MLSACPRIILDFVGCHPTVLNVNTYKYTVRKSDTTIHFTATQLHLSVHYATVTRLVPYSFSYTGITNSCKKTKLMQMYIIHTTISTVLRQHVLALKGPSSWSTTGTFSHPDQ